MIEGTWALNTGSDKAFGSNGAVLGDMLFCSDNSEKIWVMEVRWFIQSPAKYHSSLMVLYNKPSGVSEFNNYLWHLNSCSECFELKMESLPIMWQCTFRARLTNTVNAKLSINISMWHAVSIVHKCIFIASLWLNSHNPSLCTEGTQTTTDAIHQTAGVLC